MGPRLLGNFTSDRGNQVTLGTFISTFAFSLYTLRNVQGGDPPFVPHYNTTAALLWRWCPSDAGVLPGPHHPHHQHDPGDQLAARRHAGLAANATQQHGQDPPGAVAPPDNFWEKGEELHAPSSGYLQLLDTDLLLKRAAQANVALRLLVRPGDYVFPNSLIAVGVPKLPEGVMDALTLGDNRTIGQDLEFSVRQLSEVAARALSPGVNDPVTAIDVIDRFGDALCSLQDRRWPDGVFYRDGQLRLVMPVTDFGGLLSSMFDMIRQYGKGSPSVVIRLLEVLTVTASCLKTRSAAPRSAATPICCARTPWAAPRTQVTGPISRSATAALGNCCWATLTSRLSGAEGPSGTVNVTFAARRRVFDEMQARSAISTSFSSCALSDASALTCTSMSLKRLGALSSVPTDLQLHALDIGLAGFDGGQQIAHEAAAQRHQQVLAAHHALVLAALLGGAVDENLVITGDSLGGADTDLIDLNLN